MTNKYRHYSVYYRYYNPHIRKCQKWWSGCFAKSVDDAITEIRKKEYWRPIRLDKIVITDIDGSNEATVRYFMQEYPAYQFKP